MKFCNQLSENISLVAESISILKSTSSSKRLINNGKRPVRGTHFDDRGEFPLSFLPFAETVSAARP